MQIIGYLCFILWDTVLYYKQSGIVIISLRLIKMRKSRVKGDKNSDKMSQNTLKHIKGL